MASTPPDPQHAAGGASPEPKRTTADEAPPSAAQDAEARLFYERLEQTGQLVDVDAHTDVAALPPHVTHIRYPDGTVKRIRFTAAR